jgi:hypothetical protein
MREGKSIIEEKSIREGKNMREGLEEEFNKGLEV